MFWGYSYGGIFENDSREYTLDDFYSLSLDKLDRYTCLRSSGLEEEAWLESEEEEDDSEDSGSDDGSDDGPRRRRRDREEEEQAEPEGEEYVPEEEEEVDDGGDEVVGVDENGVVMTRREQVRLMSSLFLLQ